VADGDLALWPTASPSLSLVSMQGVHGAASGCAM